MVEDGKGFHMSLDIFNLAPSEYHTLLKCNRANIFAEDSYLSKSVIWELASSSLYKWRHYKPTFKASPAMVWGSLVDCLATTPERAAVDIVVSPYDSYRSKDAQAWKAEQEAAGKIITDNDTLAEAQAAVKMLTETCKASADIFARSGTQKVLAGKVLGVKVKGLCDLAPDGVDYLADLKTTTAFSIEGFSKQVASFNYHAQAGLYLGLWNAMNPNDQRHRWRFVWQDSSPPYEACVTELAPIDIEAGWTETTALIQRLIDATQNDHWPTAYADQQIITTRPTWASREMVSK